jgi:hypothetical protein
MKKITLNDLKAAQVPQSRAFKAGLKEQLLAKYPQPNHFMKTLFRLSISFAVIALLVTQVAMPGESKNTLQMFIQEASAANEEHGEQIYHASIQMENSMYFDNEDFTGWQTISQVSKELWVSPTKDLREEIAFTIWSGPQEGGTFDEVSSHDTSLSLYDGYANRLSYTKLEVTGTEMVEKDGELMEEDTCASRKQYDTNELLSQYLDQIVCEHRGWRRFYWLRLGQNAHRRS